MGFLDKAKKMAEQAQTKLDEVQKQFNENQPHPPSSGSQPAPVEYDQHGRPIRSEAPPEPVGPPPSAPTPPHGDPVAGQAAPAPPPPPAAAPTPDPAAPPEPPAAPSPDAAAPPPGSPEGVEEDRNNPSYAPPKLSSGDPLAG
jgi:hypothetical protein